MSVRLRWTGPQARTFMAHGVGEVEPGRSFPVPDDAAASFLAHEHVELAAPPAPEGVSETESEQGDEQPTASKPRRSKNTPAQSPTDPEQRPDITA